MSYKIVRALFWVAFWIALVQERLYWANVNLIFPDYNVKGCPSYMNQFWADFCIGLIFEIELTIVHQLFFTGLLYVDFFVIQKKFGFLK